MIQTSRYPATISWCDEEPEGWQDYTTRALLEHPQEFDAAMNRFERDVWRLGFDLVGWVHDSEGHELKFGFSARRDLGFVTFQPCDTLSNDRGHYRCVPTRWSVADPSTAATLPPIQGQGPDRIDFNIWKLGFDPYSVFLTYCVPFRLVRQALREYLETGTFSASIAWGERIL